MVNLPQDIVIADSKDPHFWRCEEENRMYYITFDVDKDIMLRGLCLFGCENTDYSVILEIKKGGVYPAQASKAGEFPSTLLQCQSGNYYGFEIFFDSPVAIQKNTIYQIEALMSGPSSFRGTDDISTVDCSGVTFTFTESDDLDCLIEGVVTYYESGQFPEILFSILD